MSDTGGERRHGAYKSLPVMRQGLRKRGVQTVLHFQRYLLYAARNLDLRCMDKDCVSASGAGR